MVLAIEILRAFEQSWIPLAPVQEIAPPNRIGKIRVVQGTGNTARVTVNITGRPPVTFYAYQLRLLPS